jgi:tetratricopeptide (TPR) repeat protein
VKLEGVRHQWQTWNNCGPATITMATSYFGRKETQVQAASFLKPNPDDKNVRPDELVSYVRTLKLEATWRVGGDLTSLKQLLANNIPVVAHVWIAPEPNDWMGHYRLLVGYDDRTGRLTAYDSVTPPGANLVQSYAQFDEAWRVFNRTYIPVYTPDQAPLVARILGQDQDNAAMYARALAVAQQEVRTLPEDGFAWFNLGSSLTGLGRTAEAVQAFDRARTLKLPWRMLWYQFGPYEAYLAEGRVQDVLALSAATLQRTSDLEESHYYRGRALQAQAQASAARASFQAALQANKQYTPAYHALASLG